MVVTAARPKILLVEDNEGDARLIRAALDDAPLPGFELKHVTSLRSGADVVGNESVEAILLDLGLPDSSGFQTLAEMLAVAEGTPIIVLTGQNDSSLGLAAVRNGAQDFFVKGEITSLELSRAIRTSLLRERRIGWSSKLRALLVEDNPGDRRLIENALAGQLGDGIDLKQVSSLRDALRIVVDQQIDVILLDLALPDSDGVETFRTVASLVPDVAIVVITTDADETTIQNLLLDGAQDCLIKSECREAQLIHAVRFAVARQEVMTGRDRERAAMERGLRWFDNVSDTHSTRVTSKLFSAAPLRDRLPIKFSEWIAEYDRLLDVALDEAAYDDSVNLKEPLQRIADQLGLAEATARDVIQLHISAIRAKIEGIPIARASGFLQEGGRIVLELMGYLLQFYRAQVPRPKISPQKTDS